MRLDELLFGHAVRRPRHTALVCGKRRVSYEEFAEKTISASKQKRVGERIPIPLPNGIEFVEREYAAWAAGAAVVPINTRLSQREIEFILADIEAPFKSAADDCLILYTSGTTGYPKGAVNTHANVIVQNVEHHVAAWGISEDDVFLATTPLAHRAGVGRLVNALGLGGTLVIMEKFDAAEALALVERERVTVAGFPPTVIRMLLPSIRSNPETCASLRRVIVSTEAFPVPLMREVSALLPKVEFYSVYGMSEAAVTSASLAEQLARPGTAGKPLPGVEVKIAEDGELLVRGENAVMKGYFNRPEENAEAFRGGWFHTGDVARMDAGGYLYIVDRKKDMVVTGGYNVYSKELEHVLVQHPGIADAAVVGVPDELYGEAVAAFVQLRPGARLSPEGVIEHCRARLAAYKKPRHVVFVDSLPRNSLGKVLKSELRKRGVQ
ncbi:MAG: long-chain fatty acid--CoA ligase [Betaproteobacteria bacterium]|nr:MAG: long-chain fatty acid--CoA ligase [Betaproteobacteria bacterium]